MPILTSEQFHNAITSIRDGLADNDGNISLQLTDILETYQDVSGQNATLTSQNQTLTQNNESLRNANMQLFLKVGGKEQPEENEEQNKELKYENLFNEEGGLL